MKFRELIKQVQLEGGFSDAESKDALETTTEKIAARLTDDERKDFASQLPEELTDKVLEVKPSTEDTKQTLLQSLAEAQDIDSNHAKKQLLSAWDAIKQSITDGQASHIYTQLPDQDTALLRGEGRT